MIVQIISIQFIQPDTIEKAFKDDEITVQLNAKRITWDNKNNGISILQVGNQNITLPVADLTKKSQDNNQFRPSLENGKTIHFQGGDGSTLILKTILIRVRGRCILIRI